jgi:hypothetical protein
MRGTVLDVDMTKISCVLEELQVYLHQLLKSHPWRTLDNLDLILDVDWKEDDTINLRIDVNVKGNRPVTPSYDEVLAQLIDKLRRKFEEAINEGNC